MESRLNLNRNQLMKRDGELEEEANHFNDETFGSFDPNSQTPLPSFFQGQEREDFLEEPLENEDEESTQLPSFFQGQEREDFLEEPIENDEITRNEDTFEENFFFDRENEEISQISFQMESMFKNVLEDEVIIPKSKPNPWNLPPTNQGNYSSSPIQSSGGVWGKALRKENESQESPQQSSSVETSVDRFFNTASHPPPPSSRPTSVSNAPKGALSLEELEARFSRPPEPSTSNGNILASSPTVSSIPQEPFYQPKSPRTQTSRPWREDKKRMSSAEIDFVIRTQEAQMYTGNPFVDDYYFQTMKAQRTDGLKPIHKPLFESFSRFPPSTMKKPDPFEGVLGRIPSHSVRAPRPLLQLKSEENEGTTSASDHTVSLSSRSTYSLLLTFENAFNCLLDVEDLTEIIQRPESSNNFNLNFLYQKREQLTNDLFTSLHVHILPIGTLPPKKVSRDCPFVFPQDETFIQFILVRKGRQILARSIPLLFRDHLIFIFFQFMRNLALVTGSPKLDSENPVTSKIFGYLISFGVALPVPQTILALQNVIAAHTVGYLLNILESKYGLALLQTLLKRAYDLGLSPFSKEVQIPPPSQPLIQFGAHWKETVNALFQMLQGNFSALVGFINSPAAWEFLAVLLVHLNATQKSQMLSELRHFFVKSPLEPTINAFLHLSQQL